jgi:hypothetical protein
MATNLEKMLCWRRVDMTGLELLSLRMADDAIRAVSTTICGWNGGFRIDHVWLLTPDWHAVSLHVERRGADGLRVLTLERDHDGWRVDGTRRPELDAAIEPDLSVTPFCNTLVMRKLRAEEGADLTLDVAYVDGDDLTVSRSRQRYVCRSPKLFRFIDLGLSKGFEADLQVDDERLVVRYEHLFERV